MARYKAVLQFPEASGSGDVHIDCWIKRLESAGPPEVWVDVPMGHRTLVLDGQAVLAITESSQTNPQKRQAIRDLTRAEILAWRLETGDAACQALTALITFPDEVIVKT